MDAPETQQDQRESKAQKEVGLSDIHYKRYLFITRDVAKELVKDLTQEKHRDKYSWTQVSLDRKSDTIESVNTRLFREGIPAVAEDKIGARLQKAIKDIQRSNKTFAYETAAASSSTPSVERQPSSPNKSVYDPIRDV